MPSEPVILVHGGAGKISDPLKQKILVDGVKAAAREAYIALKSGASALDASEVAVISLENNPAFNAGRGSVLNIAGEVEMDASIMTGDLDSGAVTVVKGIKNPISLARLVMEKTDHVLMAGCGAVNLARKYGTVDLVAPESLITEQTQEALNNWKSKNIKAGSELGTVGAVALDKNGKVAAATSTGGREGKLPGRSSDTCVIGSGTYADNNIGAVSTTGHGETVMKFCLAHAILKEMELGGKNAQDATVYSLGKMTERLNNTAGAITLSPTGDIGIGFTTDRMSWAYISDGNQIVYGINKDEKIVETL